MRFTDQVDDKYTSSTQIFSPVSADRMRIHREQKVVQMTSRAYVCAAVPNATLDADGRGSSSAAHGSTICEIE